MSNYNLKESTLHKANRIVMLSYFFLVAFSLLHSSVLSAPLANVQIVTNLEDAQVDNAGAQSSQSIPLLPDVAFAQTDNAGANPWPSFSLFPNVAFAQSSASFSLTVTVTCPGPGGDGGGGNDLIIGTNGADTISGNAGDDEIYGCNGGDTLNGNLGNDFIDGGEGIDTIKGNEGNDVLIGGSGNDDIDGGEGNDVLTGGPGADKFQCGSGTDTITDFSPNPPAGGEGDTIQAANQCENINPTPSAPTINQPATITDCTQNFVVTGTAQAGATITLYKKVGMTLTQLDGTTVTNSGGTWSITLNPLDPNLGQGTFTLVAKASFGAQTSGESAPKTLTIDCVVPPPVITQPDTEDCEGDITISGTAHPATDTVNLKIQGGAQIGTTNDIDDTTGAWSITLNPLDLLDLGQDEGTFTLVAVAIIGSEESEESEAVTLTIDCPLPTPTINTPDTVTDCEDTFEITGGLTGEPIGAVDTIILFKNVNNVLTEIGRTSTIAADGSWTITLDPQDADLLGLNEDEGTFTLVAQAIQNEGQADEETSELSNQVTLTIDCPLPTPTINTPDTVTDCEDTFEITGGLTGEPIGAVDTIILFKNVGGTLTEIGRTSTIAADGSWTITLDPQDADLLGLNEDEGTFTLVAQAIQNEGQADEETSELSNQVTLTIDCPLPTPTINTPDTVTDCEDTFEITGGLTGEPIGAVDTIILFKNVNNVLTEIGRTSTIAADGSWTITLDPQDADLLGLNEDEGTFTLVAQAIQNEGQADEETSELSNQVTLTIDCPLPTPTINTPDTVTDCEDTFEITGGLTGEPIGAVDTIILFKNVGGTLTEIGRTSTIAADGSWTITLDPQDADLLGLNEDEGTFTLVAQAIQNEGQADEETSELSNQVTLTIDCPLPTPTINTPDTVTDCEDTFEITGGLTGEPIGAVDTIILFKNVNNVLTEIGRTSTIAADGSWTITLDPQDADLLGLNEDEGTFTLVAQAIQNEGQADEETSELSNQVTLTIDCPLPTPTINTPDTVTDCEDTFEITGGLTGEPIGAVDTIILFKNVGGTLTEIGRTSTIAADGSWTITLDPQDADLLGLNEDEGTFTLVAQAIQNEGQADEETSELSNQVTLTIDCPLPTPTINTPDTVTDCEDTFEITGGLTGEPIGAVDTIILFKNVGGTLTEIGRTSTIAADGSWTITLDPQDADLLGLNEDEGTFTLVAQAIQNEGQADEETSELSNQVTLTIDCPLPTPTINTPDTVTDCEDTFEITGGLTGEPIGAVDTIILFKNVGGTLTEIGRTSTIAADGSWTITLDPQDADLLGLNEDEGTFTLVAQAIQNEGQADEETSELSNQVTLTIDCPLPTPTINTPDTVTDCEDTFEITGGLTGEPIGAVDTIILFKNVNNVLTEIGRTSTIAADGSWTITLDPQDADLLGLNEDEGTFTLVAQAIQNEGQADEETSELSNQVTLTIDCPLPTPTINTPDTVTDCEDTFEITGGLTGEPIGAVDTIILFKNVNNVLTEIGRTSTIAADGSWTITLDPQDADLGEGSFTLVARAIQNEGQEGEEFSDSSEITLEIDCPALPTTIDDPAGGTTIECEQPLSVSGAFDNSEFSSVELFVDGNSAGFANLNGDTWSITVPAEMLGEGTHTLVAEASTGGSEPLTSQSDPITITAECPAPPPAPPVEPEPEPEPAEPAQPAEPAEPAAPAAPAAPAPAPAPAAGIPVQIIDRLIYQRPYIGLNCTASLVELQKDLIPTTDFPALVNETILTYNVTVLNVYNVPDYKAMLLAEGDEKKVIQDTRFVLAKAICGEMILELLPDLVPVTNIFNVADEAISSYHVKVVDIINMTDYKAIVILAEPDNPITKDPKFVKYGEEYQAASNYTGAGQLDLSTGHITAPPPTIKEETIPDSIKRTFSTADLEDGEKQADVDIAILDTGIDLDHLDLNVYRNVSFVRSANTGEDDNGHGTHVAGIAAAKDNGEGIVGGAPGARLWSVKVCDKGGECKISDMIKGVEYITQHADEIDVVNISVETPLSPALNRAISASIKEGVTYVVSAGNYGKDASTTSPASNPDTITVSAIADSDGKCGGTGPALQTENATDDNFAYFSNFGPSVSIAAPGVAILSTYLDGGYAVDSGTSMAAPSVAAAAALIKANSTDLTPKQVKDTLLNSGSTPLTPCEGGPQGYFTGDPDQNKEPLLYRKLGDK